MHARWNGYSVAFNKSSYFSPYDARPHLITTGTENKLIDVLINCAGTRVFRSGYLYVQLHMILVAH